MRSCFLHCVGSNFVRVDAGASLSPVLISVGVLIGALILTVVAYTYIFPQMLKEMAKRKTKKLIEKHFCQSPPTILLLGQLGSGKTSLINTFDFVINLSANDEATVSNYNVETGDESQTEKLRIYRNLYKDYSEKAPKNKRGPIFLDSQGLPRNAKFLRPLVMMLALGYIRVETNLNDVCDDFMEGFRRGIRNAGEGDEPSNGLTDDVLELLCPEESDEPDQRSIWKGIVKEKIEFYKNDSLEKAEETAEETKPHIVLLVWSAKYAERLIDRVAPINSALRAAKRGLHSTLN